MRLARALLAFPVPLYKAGLGKGGGERKEGDYRGYIDRGGGIGMNLYSMQALNFTFTP